jgi:hypothetical protein
MLDTFPLIFETFHIIITECTVGPLQKYNLLIETQCNHILLCTSVEKNSNFQRKINIFV